MPENTVKIEAKTKIENNSAERFIVFAASGKRPLISFSNFVRAERLAIIFALLTNARMEVFDSEKEICYFVEPSEANRPSIH
jgi:hypothetical protein